MATAKTKNFLYTGPSNGVTFKDGDVEQEVMLWQGKEVTLPEAHEVTLSLQAMGYLQVLVVAPVAAATPVPSAADNSKK